MAAPSARRRRAATAPEGASAAPSQLPHHAAVPRLAEPGQAFVAEPIGGTRIELVADAQGVVRPHTSEEVRLLDEYRLPAAGDAVPDDSPDDTGLAPEKEN